MPPLSKVIIVGAGPAGLLLALLLSKAGIAVDILEKEIKPTDEARAVIYQPISLYEFERAGIKDSFLDAALSFRSIGVRKIDGEKMFEMPGGYEQYALSVKELLPIIQRHLEREEGAKIHWGHRVTGVGQDGSGEWVDVETPEGRKRFTGDYVVGCDGGQSIVRRTVFGEEALKGFTWEQELVAADIDYDFNTLAGLDDSNLFIHPTDAFVLFRVSKVEPHRWRMVYRVRSGLTKNEIDGEARRTLNEFLGGKLKCDSYRILRLQPYRIHQRIVDEMRRGRIVLASDAGHLCCPYGALGLNGGIADIGSLYDCLLAIHIGRADDGILDVYSEVRRAKWKQLIDPQSQRMCRTVFSDPDGLMLGGGMYRMSQMLREDPENARKSMPDPLALRYDFTPHFADTSIRSSTAA